MTLSRRRPWILCLVLASLFASLSSAFSPTGVWAAGRDPDSMTGQHSLAGTPARSVSTRHRLRHHLAIRPHSGPASDLSNYAYQVPITVTGGSAAVGGSTTTPVPATSTDYVVMVHLTGSNAWTLYNSITYNATTTYNGTPFADVTIWWTDSGGAAHQLDVDYDTTTYGAWGPTNITLWFRLQRPLGAAPATDTSYTLAWGNPTPTVLRTWANIYPLSDDFLGTSLGSQWSTFGSPSVSIASSRLTLSQAATGATHSGITSVASFGTNYQLLVRGTMPLPVGNAGEDIRFQNTGSGFPSAASDLSVNSTPTSWQIANYNAGWGTLVNIPALTIAGTDHIFTVARDAAGNTYGSVDGQRASVSTPTQTAAMPVTLHLAVDGSNGAAMTVDWLKVRPYVPTEPVVSLAPLTGTLDLPGALARYAYQMPITVVGGSAAVGGSTTTPVPVTSTDYVVPLHLTGSQAAAVYNNAVYNATTTYNGTPFGDVTLWDSSGAIPQQLDIDVDTSSYGAWSPTNIMLWFRLQRPLGAAPAADASYTLAWGNPTPTVLRTWANIYPLSDDFLGTSLGSQWSTFGSPTVSVSGDNLGLSLAAANPHSGIFSSATFGPGYQIRLWGTMPPVAGNASEAIRLQNPSAGFPSAGVSIDTNSSPNQWQVDNYNGGWGTPVNIPGTIDSAAHVFTLARDASGNSYATMDGNSASIITTPQVAALPVELHLIADAVNGASMTADWVKVRPWISGTEPAVTAGTLGAGPSGQASGLIPYHVQYRQALSSGLATRVDLSDGHLDLTAGAVHLPGRGFALALDQTYDSALAQAGITTTQGQGWVSSLTPSMGGVLTGTVLYTDTTGATFALTYTGAPSDPGPYTAYTVPAGEPWQLTTSRTGGYTLTNTLSGAQRTFSVQGQYLADSDSYGNTNSAVYSGGVPNSWTNSGGHALTLVAQNGLLSEVKSPLWVTQGSGAPASQNVTYGYSGTQLLTMTMAAGTSQVISTTFGYSGAQMVAITTPVGQQWGIQYDPFGRVSRITSPISGTSGQAGYTPADTTRFVYTPGQTQVIAGYGSSAAVTTTYGLDAAGEPVKVTDADGNVTAYTYDADHDVTSVTNARGYTTKNYFAYVGAPGSGGIASTGLVTETDRPAIDGTGPITTGYTYDGNNNLVKTVSGTGGLTYYQYDGSHHTVITTTQLLTGTVWRGTVDVISPTTGLLLGRVDGRGVTVPAPAQGLTPTATLNGVAPVWWRLLS